MDKSVLIDGREVRLTNMEKIFWPDGLTKAQVIEYYYSMAGYILPHLRNRPVVMKRYPEGIEAGAFYQKECPDYAPGWIKTHPIRHTGKTVNYIVCNDTATLVWLANQACIEIHAWLSLVNRPECPDIAVMDLDPAEGSTFGDVMDIALLCRRALEEFGLAPYVKTSGASGLHLFVPIENDHPFQMVSRAMKHIAVLVASVYPQKATIERAVAKRTGKVYLDYLQNGRGKTMAFQYSLRPLPGAPVSTPLFWSEVESRQITPGLFNIGTIKQRLKAYGDIMLEAYRRRFSIGRLLAAAGSDRNEQIEKKYDSVQEINI